MMPRLKCVGLLFAAAVVFAAPAAHAARACYGNEETHAEQLLRLHSELMVITALCRSGSTGQPLPAAYGSFTQNNIDLLRGAERTMMAYYKGTARGNATSHLDRLRTLLANEYGQKAATMTSPHFCAAYRDKVLYYSSATPKEIESEARHLGNLEKAYAPLCDVKKTSRKAP